MRFGEPDPGWERERLGERQPAGNRSQVPDIFE